MRTVCAGGKCAYEPAPRARAAPPTAPGPGHSLCKHRIAGGRTSSSARIRLAFLVLRGANWLLPPPAHIRAAVLLFFALGAIAMLDIEIVSVFL